MSERKGLPDERLGVGAVGWNTRAALAGSSAKVEEEEVERLLANYRSAKRRGLSVLTFGLVRP